MILKKTIVFVSCFNGFNKDLHLIISQVHQCMLCGILYCSILGMHIFGCKFSLKTETGDTVPDRKNFDSLLWAIVTVFQVFNISQLWFIWAQHASNYSHTRVFKQGQVDNYMPSLCDNSSNHKHFAVCLHKTSHWNSHINVLNSEYSQNLIYLKQKLWNVSTNSDVVAAGKKFLAVGKVSNQLSWLRQRDAVVTD